MITGTVLVAAMFMVVIDFARRHDLTLIDPRGAPEPPMTKPSISRTRIDPTKRQEGLRSPSARRGLRVK